LAEANGAAMKIGSGDFNVRLPIRSQDELGRLALSINQMRDLLERSYRDLEARVAARTSELETMAKENERLYEQASSAVRMRDEFFSIASPELKTPLTGLNLHLQLLSRQFRASDTPQAKLKIEAELESCLRQTRRLAVLSSELMDLTRIRLGKLEIRRESCDLAAIAHDAALLLGGDAAQAGAGLEVRASTPVVGQFDPARLGQVVTNLISNAIKYGNSQPVTVEVRKEGALACIVVRDQGLGIAPDDLGRIFDRFERVDEKDAKVAGLGLGLYITQQIVETHGGTIGVQSVVGRGSVFTVELPLSG
jgi:signal transduction histidine kinase